MKKSNNALGEWLECFKEVTRDLAAKGLRFDAGAAADLKAKPDERRAGAARGSKPRPDDSRPGAYIALVGDSTSMHLGISSTPQGCRVLARSLLGMRKDGELTDKDAMDGVAEVINIVAGKVKSKMKGRDGALLLGIPISVPGPIQVTGNMERVSADVKIGPVPCQLLVFRSKRAA